jgi:hypothetical protein
MSCMADGGGCVQSRIADIHSSVLVSSSICAVIKMSNCTVMEIYSCINRFVDVTGMTNGFTMFFSRWIERDGEKCIPCLGSA